MKKLRLGVLGMSEGNGHPYSWSAIFNGYDAIAMANCPFPTIPEYLSKEAYPEQFLSDIAEVTHVWTQDEVISQAIAKAAKIEKVVRHYTDLIGKVDAVLLARDDAENHYEMALPFLKAGVPIFIDKPFALTISEAKNMIASQQFESQIFTCSSLRYASEILLTDEEINNLGVISEVTAYCPKYWNTYAVHLLEPIIVNCTERGKLLNIVKASTQLSRHSVNIRWENLYGVIHMTKEEAHQIEFVYKGKNNKVVRKYFNNSFNCFKKSLEVFVSQTNLKENFILREETLEIVKIIENGK